jgi:hypothetical protein
MSWPMMHSLTIQGCRSPSPLILGRSLVAFSPRSSRWSRGTSRSGSAVPRHRGPVGCSLPGLYCDQRHMLGSTALLLCCSRGHTAARRVVRRLRQRSRRFAGKHQPIWLKRMIRTARSRRVGRPEQVRRAASVNPPPSGTGARSTVLIDPHVRVRSASSIPSPSVPQRLSRLSPVGRFGFIRE